MLLINSTPVEIIQTVITALIGMFGVAMGLEGYAQRKIAWPLRIISIIGGLLLIVPGIKTDIVGLIIVGTLYFWQRLQSRDRMNVT